MDRLKACQGPHLAPGTWFGNPDPKRSKGRNLHWFPSTAVCRPFWRSFLGQLCLSFAHVCIWDPIQNAVIHPNTGDNFTPLRGDSLDLFTPGSETNIVFEIEFSCFLRAWGQAVSVVATSLCLEDGIILLMYQPGRGKRGETGAGAIRVWFSCQAVLLKNLY